MFQIMFYLIVAVTLLYAQTVVATEYNKTIGVRERCETCIAHFSSQNVNLNEIETYEGFEGFLIKYDAVQHYGVEDPELICLLTDMCPFNDEEPQSDLNDNYDEQNYDSDLVVEEEQNVIDFKLTNPLCNACTKIFQFVLNKIKRLADKRPNKGTVRDFFSKGCRYVPRTLRSSCTVFIKKKSGELVKMALKHYAPKLACKMAKACF